MRKPVWLTINSYTAMMTQTDFLQRPGVAIAEPSHCGSKAGDSMILEHFNRLERCGSFDRVGDFFEPCFRK